MGLFDKFSKSYDSFPKSEADAWMGIFYACISADDDVDESERHLLVKLVMQKEKFEDVDIVESYRNAMKAKSSIGTEEMIKVCCPAIDDDYQATVFTLAVELVLADGVVDSEEEKIIDLLSRNLSINTDLAEKIIEVVIIRNKGNVN